MSLKYSALVTYPATVARLNSTADRRRYSIDSGYTLLEYLLRGSAETETEDIEAGAEKDVSHYRSSSLESTPLRKLISRTFSTNGRQEWLIELVKAVRPIKAPLRNCFATEFEVFSKTKRLQDALQNWRRTTPTF